MEEVGGVEGLEEAGEEMVEEGVLVLPAPRQRPLLLQLLGLLLPVLRV